MAPVSAACVTHGHAPQMGSLLKTCLKNLKKVASSRDATLPVGQWMILCGRRVSLCYKTQSLALTVSHVCKVPEVPHLLMATV